MSSRGAARLRPPPSRRRGGPWLPDGEIWLGPSPAIPDAPAALVFPGAYPAAMASLGYLAVLRELLAAGVPTHRVPLAAGAPPESLEEGRPLRSYRLLGVSVAYELEVPVIVEALRRAELDPDPRRRTTNDPLIIAGGALTLVNPRPLLAFADAVVMGEGIDAVRGLARTLASGAGRAHVLEALAERPNVLLSATAPAEEAIAERHLRALGAYTAGPGPLASPVVTEGTAFGESFLVEACRGCPRTCSYCVLRRDRCGAFVPYDVVDVLAAVPAAARRVGLVGAGISDHPALDELLAAFVERGVGVTTSSLRVGALGERRLRLLAAAGARQLTVGIDGLSERLRRSLGKPIADARVLELAENARSAGLESLKLYVMVGVPGEEDGDVAEFVALVRGTARRLRVAVSAGPLVPKPCTPLADVAPAPASIARARLGELRRRLASVARLDLASLRGAGQEHAWAHASLAQARALSGLAP